MEKDELMTGGFDMAVPWFEILIIIIGIIFGYVRPGKEDKWALLKNGIIIGLILGIIFAILGLVLTPFIGVIGLGFGIAGGIGILISIIILTILFIIGVFIGDFLEGVMKK
jgi:hypothetical protein